MILKEKAVFITGGARGIGYGIAHAALAAGAQVAIGDLHERAVFAARESLLAELSVSGDAVLATVLDVADERSVEEALTAAWSYFGLTRSRSAARPGRRRSPVPTR